MFKKITIYILLPLLIGFVLAGTKYFQQLPSGAEADIESVGTQLVTNRTITDTQGEGERIPVTGSYSEEEESQLESQDEVDSSSEREESERPALSHSLITPKSEQSDTSTDETPGELDDAIYNVDLMAANGIEPINPTDYNSIQEVIFDLIHYFDVNQNQIGVAYYNYQTDDHFYINGNDYRIAASTNKLPLAGVYMDLIEAGEYSLDTHLPFKESYFYEGNGNITNSPLQSSYAIEDLIFESLAYSDNTAWYTLGFNYIENHQSVRQGILDFVDGGVNVPENYYSDNYASPALLETSLIKISTDPTYAPLINILHQTSPRQLFTSYVKADNMATKFGRIDDKIHDTGIYYENGEPQYALVVMTESVSQADMFIEQMNLNINQWYRANYIN